MANDLKSVRMGLAKALAAHKIEDRVIDEAARNIAALPERIRRIDVCQFGICIDFFLDGKDWGRTLNGLVEGRAWRKLDVFPYGIPFDDMVHVRLGQALEGMSGGHF